MKTWNITSAKKLKQIQAIELIITEPISGHEEKRKFQDIRGGISWPTAKAPGYFCIVGQEYVPPDYMGNKVVPGKKLLLTEFQSDGLNMQPFYEKIMDRTNQMLCSCLYAELTAGKITCGYESDFEEHARLRGTFTCRIDDAYDADNFVLGLSRIKDNIHSKFLIIPEDSLIINELRGITQQDLEEQPAILFPAINGLRHALSSFYRDPPIIKKKRSLMDERFARRSKRTFMSN